MEMIMDSIKQTFPVLISAGFGFGVTVGAIPTVLGYVISKVQSLIDI